uniref:Uncharacterized protein n=1 Tax=Glossina morsitans morsitans TaxID=37546 RepID=A0A1B0GEZ1_GLOMM
MKSKCNAVISRLIPMSKLNGFLPTVPTLTALSALGGLAGSAIVKAVNDIKNEREQLAEATQLLNNLPNRLLTDVDLIKYDKQLKHFTCAFIRDSLPKKPLAQECGIVNLDNSNCSGTHWVAYYNKYKYKQYFDSFGNL